jgi:hypothetical protein
VPLNIRELERIHMEKRRSKICAQKKKCTGPATLESESRSPGRRFILNRV